jgi:phosphate transport system protein
VCNPEDFAKRLDRLRADLVEQGRRVQSLVDSAFEAVFNCDTALADRVVDQDDAIDRVDVDLEKASVKLLSDATVPDSDTSVSHANIRTLLTVVKVNNELERIADLGVDVAGRVKGLAKSKTPMPDTIRVMSNSALGIIRDVIRALEQSDANLATVVLQSEDAVETFKKAILRDAEERIAAGELNPGEAFLRHEIANLCERMADHCTNIAEQVIYSATGKIVRHTEGQWEDVTNVAG